MNTPTAVEGKSIRERIQTENGPPHGALEPQVVGTEWLDSSPIGPSTWTTMEYALMNCDDDITEITHTVIPRGIAVKRLFDELFPLHVATVVVVGGYSDIRELDLYGIDGEGLGGLTERYYGKLFSELFELMENHYIFSGKNAYDCDVYDASHERRNEAINSGKWWPPMEKVKDE